ncbi:MAG: hypothetical protein Q7T91_10800 [Sulfuricurvum sp.]|nr:hypothetical protein [Sulfuricurvum sp.]
MKKITKAQAIEQIAKNIMENKYGYAIDLYEYDVNNFANQDRVWRVDFYSSQLTFHTNGCNQGSDELTLKNLVSVVNKCVDANAFMTCEKITGKVYFKKLIRKVRNESIR